MGMKVKLLDFSEQYQSLRDEVQQAIKSVCDTQSFILGPAVEEFEKNLAEYCQTAYAVGVSSGSDALLCAMMALDLKPGEQVICPSFTFFATAGAIARLGAVPVFADIDPRTFNIDPADIEHRITDQTRAIMPVHLFGQCADMDAINAIAQKHGLAVIEDAAQAIGAKYRGRRACSLSQAGCLSFYPTKNLGAFGDAGAICTNDEQLAQKFRKLRVHGSGHTYYHEMVGGMFRMAALQAAVLKVKLGRLEQWHAARRKNAAWYDSLLKDSKVQTPYIQPENWSVYNQYVVRVANRDAVKAQLAEAGVGSAVYYPLPLHRQPCFAYLNVPEGSLPHTERACGEVLALPIYPELTEPEIQYVAQQLRRIVG